MICTKCGLDNNQNAKFCRRCGAKLETERPGGKTERGLHCPRCGAPVKPGVKFCRNCGAKLENPELPEEKPRLPDPVCPGCGKPITPGVKFCNQCGHPVLSAAAAPKPAGKTVPGKKQAARIGLIAANILLAAACIAVIIIGIRTIPDSVRAFQAGPGAFSRLDLTPNNDPSNISDDPEDLLTPRSPGYVEDEAWEAVKDFPHPHDDRTEEGGAGA